jgi:hypothetical protein
MDIMGWVGNFFIIVGLYKVGNKTRSAFVWTIIGETCFAVHTFSKHDWPIFVAVLIFLFLAALNWWKWGREEVSPQAPVPDRPESAFDGWNSGDWDRRH